MRVDSEESRDIVRNKSGGGVVNVVGYVVGRYQRAGYGVCEDDADESRVNARMRRG